MDEHEIFNKYRDFIGGHSFSSNCLPRELLMDSDGVISVFYAPFDYVNGSSKVVICGITPGVQQALLALDEAHRQLNLGKSVNEVLKLAKERASFGGPMRRNLVQMLDFVRLSHKLGLQSCSQLFSSDTNLVHYTSALRYPVLRNGGNYNGSPDMTKHPLLARQVDSYLVEEVNTLPTNAIWIPLGPNVSSVLRHLETRGILKPDRVLHGLPHPSGANAERISYFLAQKEKSRLSPKTDGVAIDNARRAILAKIAGL
ncbi:MAG: hypothetical protein KJ624_08480 [Chloroflexi bacterium]|nr:hypothetical protein [Chloroflexota bacterium]